MSFDGFQREVLAELGLAAYVLMGAPSPVADVPPHTQTARKDTGTSPALLGALLRAAAAERGREEVLALCHEFLAANPTPSPQARRALWPSLRRLRPHLA